MSEHDERVEDLALRRAFASSEPRSAHLDPEAWEAFLGGTLAPAVHEAALDHVSACPSCAAIFREARLAALAGAAEAVATAKDRRRSARVPALATLAASLAVGASVLLLMRPAGTPSMAPAPGEPAPITARAADPLASLRIEKAPVVVSAELLLATRGGRGDAAYVEALARALEPYRRDDFPEAGRRLGSLAAERPGAFEPAFYLGISLLLEGRATEATQALARAEASASPARREEATFYLALARARAGDREAARSGLDAVCRAQGERSAEACRALAAAGPKP